MLYAYPRETELKHSKYYHRVVELYENFYASSSFVKRAGYIFKSKIIMCCFTTDKISFKANQTGEEGVN